MRIRELRLSTQDVPRQAAFYSEVLGLPLLSAKLDAPGAATVIGAGSTRLIFSDQRAGEAIYHFAFNIPPRKFVEAKAWLAARVPLVGRDGKDQVRFESWNADAVYFRDPAGNVAELIARHNLTDDTPGPFGPADFLNVSEIGLAVPNVPTFVKEVEDRLGLVVWRGGSEEFAAVGDEHGLLIVMREGRPMLLSDLPARPWPTGILIEAAREGHYALPELGYDILAVADFPSRQS